MKINLFSIYSSQTLIIFCYNRFEGKQFVGFSIKTDTATSLTIFLIKH